MGTGIPAPQCVTRTIFATRRPHRHDDQAMTHQSPISPGISWYEAALEDRPAYPALDGSRQADVVIVGGGFTGLSAAAHLARRGVDTVLVDGARFGDGASGRNGGQLGTGQRIWPEDQARTIGYERARALFDLAEDAKRHLFAFVAEYGIGIDYVPGQLSVAHKQRYVSDYRRHVDAMARDFGYSRISFMDREETAARLGSSHYYGGTRDTGTGHVNPLKLVVGTAGAAAAHGAALFENTRATRIASQGGRVTVTTERGTINAQKCLLALNAHGAGLEPTGAACIMPIGSFIAATAPLPPDGGVLPGNESVDDSRFVVRYFRKSADGRLLFGGREVYSAATPKSIADQLRRQIETVYPGLAGIEITHAWGGSVAITVPRTPFVREVMANVISVGGWSGHGVLLSHFVGRLYAEVVAGNRERLRLLEALHVPPFPGGQWLREPLLFLALNWYALRDRI